MPIEKTYTDSPFTSEVHCPAAVTPFDKDGDLMVDEFKEVLRFHLDVNRVDAFLIAGDNGEGYTLSADELARVTRAAAEEIGKRVPFYVHVTRTSNAESLERARAAAEAGAYGICLMPQTYIHKATAAEIVARYAMVAKAVPLPMMVYNSPNHTHIEMSTDVLSSICDVAPIEAVKDGSREFLHITEMIEAFGHRFPFLYGGRMTLVPTILLGAGGLVSTGPELFGSRVRELFEVHDMTPAQRLDVHIRYGTVNHAVLESVTPPAGIKAGLNLIGVPAGVPREPVQQLSADDEARIRDVLVSVGILEGPLAKSA